ncbi:MAG TPA: hypothetical protein VK028_03300 [Micromonosporaceae bacterium]|nr:hypothetical protein [Micromonosporaceae bacterium]
MTRTELARRRHRLNRKIRETVAQRWFTVTLYGDTVDGASSRADTVWAEASQAVAASSDGDHHG